MPDIRPEKVDAMQRELDSGYYPPAESIERLARRIGGALRREGRELSAMTADPDDLARKRRLFPRAS